MRRRSAVAGAALCVSVLAGGGVVSADTADEAPAESLRRAGGADLGAHRVAFDLDAHRVAFDLDAFVEDLSADVVLGTADEDVELIVDADVLFAFGSAEVSPEAAAALDEVAAHLDGLGAGDGTVVVVGHTDAIGEADANQLLSEDRAEAVRAELEPRLAGDFDFDVSGRGEEEPIASNTLPDGSDNEAGRALNRRVEIRFERG